MKKEEREKLKNNLFKRLEYDEYGNLIQVLHYVDRLEVAINKAKLILEIMTPALENVNESIKKALNKGDAT